MPHPRGAFLQAVKKTQFFATMFIKPNQTSCPLQISEQDIAFMQYALDLADLAEAKGEIPVGQYWLIKTNRLSAEAGTKPFNSVIHLHTLKCRQFVKQDKL